VEEKVYRSSTATHDQLHCLSSSLHVSGDKLFWLSPDREIRSVFFTGKKNPVNVIDRNYISPKNL
jgi:hypothetical protein